MNGYIARKGDRWYAVVYEDVDPETGRERRRRVPAGSDRAEAEALAAQLGAREEERRSGRRSQMTVAGFLLRYWLPAKQLQLAPVTFAGYQRMVRLHVIPHIGDVVLRNLQPDQLEQLYKLLLEEGRSDHKGGLSPKTVLEIHVILRAACADAVRKRLLRDNPASAANAPKHRRNTNRAHRVWTADQLRCFLQQTAGLRHHPTFWLASHTGMQRSEILGLRWGQVDVDAGRPIRCLSQKGGKPPGRRMRPDRTGANSSTGEHRPTGGNHQTYSPPAGYAWLIWLPIRPRRVRRSAVGLVGLERCL